MNDFLSNWVRQKNEEGSPGWKVGTRVIYQHGNSLYDYPELKGKLVEITGGSYLGGYGRVSNFWYWRKVLKNGKLSKKEYHGYGW